MATVLLVEDNDDVREMMSLVLQLAGNQVIEASNGREALSLLQAGGRPCVILLDLMMPVMSGWELGAALAEDRALSAIPVIVLSALGEDTTLRPWAAGKLPKPVDIDKLIDVVSSFCR